jgi:hypothetical protein
MRYRYGIKRILAGIFLVWLMFCAANYYLDWNYLGSFAKRAVVLSVFLAGIYHVRYGDKTLREMRAYKRLKRIRSRKNLAPVDLESKGFED